LLIVGLSVAAATTRAKAVKALPRCSVAAARSAIACACLTAARPVLRGMIRVGRHLRGVHAPLPPRPVFRFFAVAVGVAINPN
jgi:hypothetical protein